MGTKFDDILAPMVFLTPEDVFGLFFRNQRKTNDQAYQHPSQSQTNTKDWVKI